MKCPACAKQLTEMRVDKLVVDVCEHGCGGVWFDAFELQQVDEPEDVAGGKLSLALEELKGHVQPAAKEAKRECPRCEGIKLKKHFFSPKRRVHVDQCPNCGGYWLDYGELQVIRAETVEKALEEAEPKGPSMEMIRHLYRLRTEGRDSAGGSQRA